MLRGFTPTVKRLDGAFDCSLNCKAIFNRGKHQRQHERPKKSKRGRKPFFDPASFEERFNTIERVFAWEDKLRRLLHRSERLSQLHYAFKTLAYTLINLRHFCKN